MPPTWLSEQPIGGRIWQAGENQAALARVAGHLVPSAMRVDQRDARVRLIERGAEIIVGGSPAAGLMGQRAAGGLGRWAVHRHSIGDGPDSNLADGVCYDGVVGCTLRAAINSSTGSVHFILDVNGHFR